MDYLWWIGQYLRFRKNAFHLHGIHSPFIFELSKVLQDSRSFPGYVELLRFRESVKNNSTILNIIDHGAGSRVFDTNERRVSDLAKYNSTSLKRAKALHRIVGHYRPANILELGTSLGVASHAMAVAHPQTRITTIEGSPEIAAFTSQNLEKHKAKNVNVVTATFDQHLEQLDKSSIYDLIFIDGHHSGDALISYFEKLLPHAHENTMFILDDIRWSKDMYRAWKKLCDHDYVTAAVDTFLWGFLFIRPQQRQELFCINLK